MKKYIPVIIIAIVIIALIKMLAPKQINWTPSYSRDDKIPFGNYALYKLLPSMFPSSRVVSDTRTPYEVILGDTGNHAGIHTTYFFINSMVIPDNSSTESLLEFVASGNDVFIASNIISNQLLDTLNVNHDYILSTPNSVSLFELTTPNLLREKGYYNDTNKNVSLVHYYKGFDTLTTTVLGTVSLVTKNEGAEKAGKVKMANFVRVKFGEGYFYLHPESNLFTNYYLLDPQCTSYITNSISHLSGTRMILWDEHFKYGKERKSETLLAAVTSDETLIYIYYFILIGTTLYIFLGGKRRQRIIPIITPPKNTTLEYVTTVGKLYYQHRDSQHIIESIINYFHDYLRTKYFLAQIDYGSELYEKIALKTGLELNVVEILFDNISNIRQKIEHTDKDVIKLNKLIIEFKNTST